jgi:hypothetical protein
MALRRGYTIQELLFRQILSSFLILACQNKIQISIKELYMQQDRVQNNFNTLTLKHSLTYIGKMVSNQHLTDELVSLDKCKIRDNNLIMDYMYFLQPIKNRKKEKTKKEILKEFVYKMKMMGLEREATELIDYSEWGKGNKDVKLRASSLDAF